MLVASENPSQGGGQGIGSKLELRITATISALLCRPVYKSALVSPLSTIQRDLFLPQHLLSYPILDQYQPQT